MYYRLNVVYNKTQLSSNQTTIPEYLGKEYTL